ncbi:MAG: hypothetical protein JXR70_02655 [Spirochaetales bacterium]|nr:hypothetical protein [Spirochaetales bacterium]
MRNRQFTIWFLNRADEICLGVNNELDFLSDPDLAEIKEHLVLGNRDDPRFMHPKAPVKHVKYKHNLMLEDEIDEYYVELALKCLGNKSKTCDQDAQILLDNIRDPGHNRCFAPETFRDYWNYKGYKGKKFEIPSTLKMATAEYQGFYQILEQTKPNILVAYSQGGLVAWYLAFLEEKIFNKNKKEDPVIAGFISMDSPNYGSPLANPDNAETVKQGICDALLEFTREESSFGIPRKIKALTRHLGIKHVYRLMDFLGVLFLYSPFIGLSDFSATIRTFRKWTFGLDARYVNAFDDLNITNIHENNEGPEQTKFSVLNLLHQEENYLTQTPFACVAGCNNKISDILYSLKNDTLMKTFDPKHRHRRSCIFSMMGVVMTIVLTLTPGLFCFSLLLWKVTFRKFWKNLYSALFNLYNNVSDFPIDRLTLIFKDRLLTEIYDNDRRNRKQAYDQGCSISDSVIIPPQAHDCAVPSVNQLIPGENALFQEVNFEANHNSGKSVKSKGGQKNYRLIKDFIKACVAFWEKD